MEVEPNIFEQMNTLYNRSYLPSEYQLESTINHQHQLFSKFYDEMCYTEDEEKDFFTSDPTVLRNTAINSLLGRGPITEEKIQNEIQFHLNKQREFYENWKDQQVAAMLGLSFQ